MDQAERRRFSDGTDSQQKPVNINRNKPIREKCKICICKMQIFILLILCEYILGKVLYLVNVQNFRNDKNLHFAFAKSGPWVSYPIHGNAGLQKRLA